jgi:hypothetical protein
VYISAARGQLASYIAGPYLSPSIDSRGSIPPTNFFSNYGIIIDVFKPKPTNQKDRE